MTFVFQLVAGWEAIQDMNYTGEDDGEQEGAMKRHAAKIGLFLCDWEPGLFLCLLFLFLSQTILLIQTR